VYSVKDGHVVCAVEKTAPVVASVAAPVVASITAPVVAPAIGDVMQTVFNFILFILMALYNFVVVDTVMVRGGVKYTDKHPSVFRFFVVMVVVCALPRALVYFIQANGLSILH
jgi:small-conductance mechanosensitive channel